MKEGAKLAQMLRKRRQRRDITYGLVAVGCAVLAGALTHPFLAGPVGKDYSSLLFFAAASLCLTACIRLIEGRSILRIGDETHTGVRAIVRVWAVIYVMLLGGFVATKLAAHLPDPLWSSGAPTPNTVTVIGDREGG